MERRMEGAERNEATGRALVGLRGDSHRNREIHFLCDKCGLAGYTCQMWQGFGKGMGTREGGCLTMVDEMRGKGQYHCQRATTWCLWLPLLSCL